MRTIPAKKGNAWHWADRTYVHDVDGRASPSARNSRVSTTASTGADEFYAVDDLVLSAKMYTQIIIDMCE
jgi:hypothetical protein